MKVGDRVWVTWKNEGTEDPNPYWDSVYAGTAIIDRLDDRHDKNGNSIVAVVKYEKSTKVGGFALECLKLVSDPSDGGEYPKEFGEIEEAQSKWLTWFSTKQ